MKRTVLFFVLIAAIMPTLMAQSIKFNLKPNEPAKKEISITGSNSDSFDVWLELKWDEENNRIQLSFDLREISGEADKNILCLPLMQGALVIDDIVDCKYKKKKLWRGSAAKRAIKQLEYFMKSEDLKLTYQSCYKLVAPNLELEEAIGFNIMDNKEKIVISLSGLYVLKNKKKNFLSKRDMQIEDKANPVELEITLEKDPCAKIGHLISGLQAEIDRLEKLKSDIETARDAKNCSEESLSSMKNETKTFLEDNPELSNHGKCMDLVNLIENYKEIRAAILSIQCKPVVPPPPPRSCNLVEVNKRLFSLQKAINSKKAKKENYDAEKNDFYEIRDKTKPSSGCKGDVVKAYNSYCKNIERALNN